MKKIQESLLEYRKNKISIKSFEEENYGQKVSLVSHLLKIFRNRKMRQKMN